MSVKANELRIGNYIKHNDENCEVFSISKEWLRVTKDRHIAISYDNLKPIELTEEILLKLGAIKLDFKDFPSFNLKGLQINFINGLWLEYVSQVEINGLHFLQNIFFFRYNEELEVNF